MIELIPTEWLERCLDIMALDPETAQPSVGLPCGRRRPEYGPAIQDLQCNNCGATWCGITGEPCDWCADALERQQEHQAELLLQPPDVERDDVNYDVRMRAWLGRMKVGVTAQLITKQQAERAFRRTQRMVA